MGKNLVLETSSFRYYIIRDFDYAISSINVNVPMLETRILINKNETREVGSQDHRQFPGGGVDALECSWPRLEPVLQKWGISIP